MKSPLASWLPLTAADGADPIRTGRGAGYSLDDRFGKAS
jgi:hypothetical protein